MPGNNLHVKLEYSDELEGADLHTVSDNICVNLSDSGTQITPLSTEKIYTFNLKGVSHMCISHDEKFIYYIDRESLLHKIDTKSQCEHKLVYKLKLSIEDPSPHIWQMAALESGYDVVISCKGIMYFVSQDIIKTFDTGKFNPIYQDTLVWNDYFIGLLHRIKNNPPSELREVEYRFYAIKDDSINISQATSINSFYKFNESMLVLNRSSLEKNSHECFITLHVWVYDLVFSQIRRSNTIPYSACSIEVQYPHAYLIFTDSILVLNAELELKLKITLQFFTTTLKVFGDRLFIDMYEQEHKVKRSIIKFKNTDVMVSTLGVVDIGKQQEIVRMNDSIFVRVDEELELLATNWTVCNHKYQTKTNRDLIKQLILTHRKSMLCHFMPIEILKLIIKFAFST